MNWKSRLRQLKKLKKKFQHLSSKLKIPKSMKKKNKLGKSSLKLSCS